LEKYIEKLQETIEELGKKNYYLEKENKVLRGFVKDY